MRIIAGSYGGRKLLPFRAAHIRPTTDRVKESIFNKIQFCIQDTFVLDLFSGTGNLAFEALSRGASRAIAVDSHPVSIRIMKKNKEEFGIGDELKILKQDVFKFLRTNQIQFDIILIDPPFGEPIGDQVLAALGQSQCLKPHTRVFIESPATQTLNQEYVHLLENPNSSGKMSTPSGLREESRQSYGDKFLSQYLVV